MHRSPTLEDVTQFFSSGFSRTYSAARSATRWIGLENEYLVVDSAGLMVHYEVIDTLWFALQQLGWLPVTDDLSGHIVGVKQNRDDLIGQKSHHYDIVTTDLGYAVLEIDLAPTSSILIAHQRLYHILALVTAALGKQNARLLGYGVQPRTGPAASHIAHKSRYPMMLDICQRENVINPLGYGVDLHTLDASCQTHVEVSTDEAIPVVNALNATSGLRTALLANSPVWQNQPAYYKALRLMFVDWCWPCRKQQLGMPPKFQNIEHYIDYIFDFRSIMVKRGQKLYQIDNDSPFHCFFTNPAGQPGKALDGHTTQLFGIVEDVITQCGLAWFSARLQPAYGTVEDRVSCQQPPSDHLCASALTVGLVENYQELLEVSQLLSLDQWRDIHQLAILYGARFSYPGIAIEDLLMRMVTIADRGLRQRGFGEEIYLAPLFERASACCCPADAVIQDFLDGGIPKIVANNDMRVFPPPKNQAIIEAHVHHNPTVVSQ